MLRCTSNFINPHILNITPYQPGRPIEEVKRRFKLKDIIKLASNENPLGPSPRALSAIAKALAGVNRYPDGDCFYLKRKLAENLKVSSGNLIFGNGSDELLDMIAKAFLNPREEEIITWDVTFLEYKITGQIFGAKVKEMPLSGFGCDLAAARRAITKNTKLILLANPNNPTGAYINKAKLDGFLDGLPEGIIVVYDEAYEEFVDKTDFPRGIMYFRKRKNFITLKTFSKIYGLAGLRIGYAVANEEFIGAMNRVRQPFNVNRLAQAAALAALDDEEFLRRSKKAVLDGKRFLYAEFDNMGLRYGKSAANFILVNTGRDVFKPLLEQGIIVRPMDMYGLKGFIRVTIGTAQENRKFITALKKVLV